MGIIIFILIAVAVAALLVCANTEQSGLGGGVKTSKPSKMSNSELERKIEKDSRDAAFLSAMLIGKTLTDTTSRLNQWDRQRQQREYDQWHWQEIARRDNSILKDPFDPYF